MNKIEVAIYNMKESIKRAERDLVVVDTRRITLVTELHHLEKIESEDSVPHKE